MFKTLCLSICALIGFSSASASTGPQLYKVKDLLKLYSESQETVIFEWYKNSTIPNYFQTSKSVVIEAENKQDDLFAYFEDVKARMALVERVKATNSIYIVDFDGTKRLPTDQAEFDQVYGYVQSAAQYPAQTYIYGFTIPP